MARTVVYYSVENYVYYYFSNFVGLMDDVWQVSFVAIIRKNDCDVCQ